MYERSASESENRKWKSRVKSRKLQGWGLRANNWMLITFAWSFSFSQVEAMLIFLASTSCERHTWEHFAVRTRHSTQARTNEYVFRASSISNTTTTYFNSLLSHFRVPVASNKYKYLLVQYRSGAHGSYNGPKSAWICCITLCHAVPERIRFSMCAAKVKQQADGSVEGERITQTTFKYFPSYRMRWLQPMINNIGENGSASQYLWANLVSEANAFDFSKRRKICLRHWRNSFDSCSISNRSRSRSEPQMPEHATENKNGPSQWREQPKIN